VFTKIPRGERTWASARKVDSGVDDQISILNSNKVSWGVFYTDEDIVFSYRFVGLGFAAISGSTGADSVRVHVGVWEQLCNVSENAVAVEFF
jgi:hypothetical protein